MSLASVDAPPGVVADLDDDDGSAWLSLLPAEVLLPAASLDALDESALTLFLPLEASLAPSVSGEADEPSPGLDEKDCSNGLGSRACLDEWACG